MARRQPLIWFALCALVRLFRGCSHRMALRLGRMAGGLVRRFSASRVAKAEARVSRILNVSNEEARRIVRGVYAHFGMAAAEFARLPVDRDRVGERVRIFGEEHLKEAFAQGRGVILLSAHFGNWEVAAARLALLGYPMACINAPQRDPRVTALIWSLRECVGIQSVGKGVNDLRAVVSCLKEGRALAVLLDQDARDAGVVVPFLGAPASTPIGPIKMSQKLRTPILPAFCVRRREPQEGCFDLHLLPGFVVPAGEEHVEWGAGRCNEVISEWIARHPEQWLWMYPRWATTLGDR